MKKIHLNTSVSAMVDDEDYDSLKDQKWRYNKVTGYAYRSESAKHRTFYMHRVILGVTDRNTQIDHINGDKLDNRRCNIRAGTRSQNQQNQKIHRDGKPVGVHHQDGKIGALIVFDEKLRWLGYWETETIHWTP